MPTSWVIWKHAVSAAVSARGFNFSIVVYVGVTLPAGPNRNAFSNGAVQRVRHVEIGRLRGHRFPPSATSDYPTVSDHFFSLSSNISLRLPEMQ